MTDNSIGIYLVATVIAAIGVVSFLMSRKQQMKLKKDRQALEADKSRFAVEQNQLRKDQEDLKNAQILFQREKEAKADLSKKTEKEVAIDLFIKFIEMESTFGYMKNNLASIDSKLVGVKNYSNDLASMESELTTYLNSLKTEMTAMQKSYSTTLSTIHNDLKTSLANIESHIEGIISSITGKEMADLSDRIDQRLSNLSSEFGKEIEDNMPSTIDEDDVERVVRNVLSGYTISSLDRYDIENAVRTVLDDKFSYSYSFEDEIKSVISSEISYHLCDLKSKISDIESKLSI